MSDPSADIEAPRGDPAGISSAAGGLSGQSASFWDMSQQLRALPGSLTTWQGPASANFAGAALAYANGAAATSDAFAFAARVTQAFADELADAQADARRAQDEARVARAQIAKAKAKVAEAEASIAAANAASSDGVPMASALLKVAEAEKIQAQAELKKAQTDLKKALADQREANERATAAAGIVRQALPIDVGLGGPGVLPPLTSFSPAGATGGQGIEPFLGLYTDLAGGGLNGMSGLMSGSARSRARAIAGPALSRAMRAYDSRTYVSGTDPRQRPSNRQRFEDRARKDAKRSPKGMPQVKSVARLSKGFGILGSGLQFTANEGRGMNTTENLTRTGFSAALGAGTATLAATGCMATVALAPVAPLCAAGGNIAGSVVGNKVGGLVYKHIIKPLGD